MPYIPLLGLMILAVPVVVIWWLIRKSKGRRTGEVNHDGWQSGSSDGGADGSP